MSGLIHLHVLAVFCFTWLAHWQNFPVVTSDNMMGGTSFCSDSSPDPSRHMGEYKYEGHLSAQTVVQIPAIIQGNVNTRGIFLPNL